MAKAEAAPALPGAPHGVFLPGVGAAVAEKLGRLGIRREADLVFHLPLRYEDETRLTPIRDALPGVSAQFEVEVISAEIAYRPRRQLVAKVRDASGDRKHAGPPQVFPGPLGGGRREAATSGGGLLILRFLNFYPTQQKVLQPGARLRVFGEVRGGFFGAEIIHPRFHVVSVDEPLPEGLTPVYPTTAGLGQATLRRLIDRAIERASNDGGLDDTLPETLRARLALPELAASIRTLHHPPPDISLEQLETHGHPAWRRVAFDELLAQQISLRRAHALRRARAAPQLKAGGKLTDALLQQLPFRLTAAQQRVWDEIAADLAAPHPMQRLLQGDVGSGKTVVAALAMLRAVDNGYQAALMAPTEILAEQHYRKLAGWLTPLGIEVGWLSGSQKKREREAWQQKVGRPLAAEGAPRSGGVAAASGMRDAELRSAAAASASTVASPQAGPLLRASASPDETAPAVSLIVGTHALIEEGVEFANLGLAIVDEQHRFGVRQRLALKRKGQGETVPHQLTMSATPIPRTLAMSYYADLDVSVIDELPPGRTPVLTKLVSDARRDEVIARVRDACRAGRQAYWVCPLIEESEALQLKTAQETFEHLTAELPELHIGLVHGRLKTDEKAAVMAAFVANAVQLLVATTVIEVGVDVPNATLMVIEHAERFGLAQLHQLRGRVGRGRHESACILLYAQPLGETARARLKIIFENGDGFEIARQDLHLRGPGEFIGARQSGLPMLRYADLEDTALIEQARTAAEELLRGDPTVVQRHLERWLGGRSDLLGA